MSSFKEFAGVVNAGDDAEYNAAKPALARTRQPWGYYNHGEYGSRPMGMFMARLDLSVMQ